MTVQLHFLIPICLGLILLMLGLFKHSAFWRWVGLAVIGQAAMLSIIDAGKAMHYQHFLTFDVLIRSKQLSLGILLLQAILVTIGLIGYPPQTFRRFFGRFPAWKIILFGLFIIVTSSAVSQDLNKYFSEILLATFILTVNLGNIALIILTVPTNILIKIRKLFYQEAAGSMTSNHHSGFDKFVLIAMLWVTCLSAFFSLVSYQRHPHIPDEVVYLLQAKFLANGVISMPAPPDQAAFEVYLMQFEGAHWYPTPPFGWPVLLSIGTLVGLPWLVNPILAGLNILLSYLVIRELYSKKTARLTILFLCLSPWFIFMGMNFMTHMFTLFCALFAVYGIIRSRLSGKVIWAIAAGISLGIMSLIRPMEGLMMAVLVGLWAIGVGGKRLSWVSIGALILATGITASLVLPYNQEITGNPLKFPINIYTDQRFGVNSNAYGFGPDRGMGWPIDPNPGHSPIDGLINAELNTFNLNVELFGWSTGSLWLIAIFLLFSRIQKSDALMIAVITAVFLSFFFYYFSGGPDFGARYWFLMVVPLVVLTIRGIQTLAYKLDPGVQSFAYERILTGVLILNILALINFFPWRSVDKYYQYLNMQPGIQSFIRENQFDQDLIFVRGENFPDYASAALYNPIDFSSDAPIFAFDVNPETTRRVINAFSDREVWWINGPTITGTGYEIMAGPIPAKELLENSTPMP